MTAALVLLCSRMGHMLRGRHQRLLSGSGAVGSEKSEAGPGRGAAAPASIPPVAAAAAHGVTVAAAAAEAVAMAAAAAAAPNVAGA
mmetsp:Transcript_24365/g.64779  ORF Transcript_24365/g.64779 Transcript_24365/m.64779 type:complete len:86 (-) Transcript_24365:1561-1818(-)